jgi:hypothetical protein
MLRLIEEQGLALLSGSHFHSEPGPQAFILWEKARRPLCDLIAGPGPLLDVGCANGFLLRCILEWCPYEIVPFGIDIDPTLVAQARVLVPDLSNFLVQDLGTGDPVLWFGRKFNTIYWNVGQNLTFTCARELDIIPRLKKGLRGTSGNLILGFYERDMGLSEEKVLRLRKHGIDVRRTAKGLFALFIEVA